MCVNSWRGGAWTLSVTRCCKKFCRKFAWAGCQAHMARHKIGLGSVSQWRHISALLDAYRCRARFEWPLLSLWFRLGVTVHVKCADARTTVVVVTMQRSLFGIFQLMMISANTCISCSGCIEQVSGPWFGARTFGRLTASSRFSVRATHSLCC